MPILQSRPGPTVTIDGRDYLNFVGTNYLGLAGHDEVVAAAGEALRTYGITTGNVRTKFGTTPPLLKAERTLAEFFGTEAALHAGQGFAGPAMIASMLLGRYDVVLLDEHVHPAGRQVPSVLQVPSRRFKHCDGDSLHAILTEEDRAGRRPLIVTDGVVAGTGRVAPLDVYAGLLDEFTTAGLLVDDSHGVGVLGAQGRGTLEHCGVWMEPVNREEPSATDSTGRAGEGRAGRLFYCVSLAKAIGTFGCAIPCDAAMHRRLLAESVYTSGATSIPPPIAAATARAIELVRQCPELRVRLDENRQHLVEGLRRMGCDVPDQPTPIIPLSIGSAENMQAIAARLKEEGILVTHSIYSGTCSEGALRLAVFADHMVEMIDRLLEAFGRVLQR